MTTLTHEPATDGQVKQIARVASDAADKAVRDYADFSKEGAQRVHGNPEFSVRVREATILALAELSVTDRFADEEVESSYGYLSGYKKPVGIEAQIDILRSHWPQLNPDAAIRYACEVYPTLQLPGWVEGPFTLIRPGFFSENDGEEIEEVLKALAKARGGKFHNYRAKQMDRFRRHAHTVAAYEQICERQPDSDILVVPEQFGIRHRGCSVRRAREVMLGTAAEFGEGAKNIGTMILTNPNRLEHYDDLWLDAPGDEFDDPDAGVRFDHAPYFVFDDSEVKFDARWYDNANDYFGSASGFVPQS